MKQFHSVHSHVAGCHYQDAYCPLFGQRTECSVSLTQILICTCRDEVPATAWTTQAHSSNWHAPENVGQLQWGRSKHRAAHWDDTAAHHPHLVTLESCQTPQPRVLWHSWWLSQGLAHQLPQDSYKPGSQKPDSDRDVQRVFFGKPSSNSAN